MTALLQTGPGQTAELDIFLFVRLEMFVYNLMKQINHLELEPTGYGCAVTQICVWYHDVALACAVHGSWVFGSDIALLSVYSGTSDKGH